MRRRMIVIGAIITIVLALAGCGERHVGNQDLGEMTLGSLADKRIGILTGTAGDNAARQMFPGAKIFDLDNVINATSALRSNKIDAIVYERTTLQGIARQTPDLAVIEEPVQFVDVAVAVKKNNPLLLNAVNQVITDLESDGTLDDMKKRWFVDSNLPAMPKLGPPSSRETLQVGTEALMPLFEFVDQGNQCSGFDIELAGRIGQALGKKSGGL